MDTLASEPIQRFMKGDAFEKKGTMSSRLHGGKRSGNKYRKYELIWDIISFFSITHSYFLVEKKSHI